MGVCAQEVMLRLLPHCAPSKRHHARGSMLMPVHTSEQTVLQQRQARLHEEIYKLELHRLQLLRPQLRDGWQVAYLETPALFYKVVAAVRGQLVSVFDGITQYHIGKWSTSCRGALGWPPLDVCYYGFDSAEKAVHAPFPSNSCRLKAPRVIIKMEAKGRAYCKSNGMWALSAVRPIAIDSDTSTGSATIVSSRAPVQKLLTSQRAPHSIEAAKCLVGSH